MYGARFLGQALVTISIQSNGSPQSARARVGGTVKRLVLGASLGSNVISADRSPMTPAVRERYAVEQFNQAVGAEMIARKWGLSRAALDEFSARSHERAACIEDRETRRGLLEQ